MGCTLEWVTTHKDYGQGCWKRKRRRRYPPAWPLVILPFTHKALKATDGKQIRFRYRAPNVQRPLLVLHSTWTTGYQKSTNMTLPQPRRRSSHTDSREIMIACLLVAPGPLSDTQRPTLVGMTREAPLAQANEGISVAGPGGEKMEGFQRTWLEVKWMTDMHGIRKRQKLGSHSVWRSFEPQTSCIHYPSHLVSGLCLYTQLLRVAYMCRFDRRLTMGQSTCSAMIIHHPFLAPDSISFKPQPQAKQRLSFVAFPSSSLAYLSCPPSSLLEMSGRIPSAAWPSCRSPMRPLPA